MWPFKKKHTSTDNDIKWYPIGVDNPFDAPIIDLRSFVLTAISTTKEQHVIENYNLSRNSDGREFIGTEPHAPISYPVSMVYPHHGEKLEGIVFKSSEMEIKWDIYAYDEWFYFVRSWSSELIFKAKYSNNGDILQITEIRAPKSYSEPEAENVHSIMLTHALGRVWPFYIPEPLQEAKNDVIALFMFSQFGSKATIATKQSVLKIKLNKN